MILAIDEKAKIPQKQYFKTSISKKKFITYMLQMHNLLLQNT